MLYTGELAHYTVGMSLHGVEETLAWRLLKYFWKCTL